MVFVVCSIMYITSLAAIDGLFNRLIFRENRKLPYSSEHKQKIYNAYWEWKAIGLILLFFLPVVLPSIVSYYFGGISYLITYWIVLLLVAWDVIFGALLFDDLFGDSPSFALPFIGWRNFDLKPILATRFAVALLLVFIRIGLKV